MIAPMIIAIHGGAGAALRNVPRLRGDGGLVAVDRRGKVVMPFNSEGMYRAAMGRSTPARAAIYRINSG